MFEFAVAIEYQDDEGYFFATALGREAFGKGHFSMWMVDKHGNTMIE